MSHAAPVLRRGLNHLQGFGSVPAPDFTLHPQPSPADGPRQEGTFGRASSAVPPERDGSGGGERENNPLAISSQQQPAADEAVTRVMESATCSLNCELLPSFINVFILVNPILGSASRTVHALQPCFGRVNLFNIQF